MILRQVASSSTRRTRKPAGNSVGMPPPAAASGGPEELLAVALPLLVGAGSIRSFIHSSPKPNPALDVRGVDRSGYRREGRSGREWIS